MKISITKTPLEGLQIIEFKEFEDERGYFMESWNKKEFEAAGISADFVQDNQSGSDNNVLRGLHYQNSSEPLAKFVRCLAGNIFDVAVDIRSSSPTIGKWFGIELSSKNKKAVFIPEGFAHGFLTLSESAEVAYKQTGYYKPEAEGIIIWNDADINIDWPIKDPILSPKDLSGLTLKQYLENPDF